MTGFRSYRCPRCELQFTSSDDLERHLAEDHDEREPAEAAGPAPPAHPPPSAATWRWVSVVATVCVVLFVSFVVIGWTVGAISAAMVLVVLAVWAWQARRHPDSRRR